ncbi:MAG: hypothetical protein H7263_09530 [Candidatus Sericytochromatia bacterium]|nr:hypothetical protein [Candidatus Sericytochromatia bacterium]
MNIRSKIFSISLIFTLSLSLNSCSLTTLWVFVDKSEVDTLLKSPDTIEFEGKIYELGSGYSPSVRNVPRSGLFNYSREIEKATINFSLYEKGSYKDDTSNLTNNLKATNFWIINKDSNYYFETSNLTLLDKGFYTLEPALNYISDYNSKIKRLDIILVKFVSISNNKTYFIKKNS